MKSQWAWFSVGAIAVVVAAGYWYVFIEDAPQLDPPPEETTKDKFRPQWEPRYLIYPSLSALMVITRC